MLWTNWIFWAAIAGLFLLALGLRSALHCKAPFHGAWTGMLGGLAALVLVHLSGAWTHITVPVSGWTAGWASITGVPGVIALLAAQVWVQSATH